MSDILLSRRTASRNGLHLAIMLCICLVATLLAMLVLFAAVKLCYVLVDSHSDIVGALTSLWGASARRLGMYRDTAPPAVTAAPTLRSMMVEHVVENALAGATAGTVLLALSYIVGQ